MNRTRMAKAAQLRLAVRLMLGGNMLRELYPDGRIPHSEAGSGLDHTCATLINHIGRKYRILLRELSLDECRRLLRVRDDPLFLEIIEEWEEAPRRAPRDELDQYEAAVPDEGPDEAAPDLAYSLLISGQGYVIDVVEAKERVKGKKPKADLTHKPTRQSPIGRRLRLDRTRPQK